MPISVVDVPTMGDSITEGTIVDLPVAPGEMVREDDVVVVLETDKVSVDVRAPTGGKIVEIMGEIDDVVEVGSNLYTIDTDAEEVPEPKEETPEQPVTAKQPAAPPAPTPPSAPTPPPVPTPPSPTPTSPSSLSAGGRPEKRSKMSRMRQRISERLKSAQNTAAMLTTFNEVDMSNLIALRNAHKDEFMAKHGVKLGFMSPFIRASTAMLLEIPAVNATIDDDAMEIVYREYVDVSVAVSSPNGLVVPVVRDADQLNFAEIEKSIAGLAGKAKDGSLSLEDMSGGTFTISNGGVFGSLMGTPILNPPQSAVLGMHATKMRAVVDGKTGDVVSRPMMYLALTYDHRLIDGREAVTFLKGIKDKIEDPGRLLLDI